MTRPDDADGLAWCDDLGRLTIDVSPDLSDDRMMYVFLHELGHIRHHNFIPLTEVAMVASPDESRDAVYKMREDQADIQAKIWIEYGKRHCDRGLPDFEGILTALLTYYR